MHDAQAWSSTPALDAILVQLGKVVLVFALAYGVGTLLLRMTGSLLERAKGRTPFFTEERTEAVRQLVRATVRYGLSFVALVVAASLLGFNVGALLLNPAVRGYGYAVLTIIAAHLLIRIGVLLIDQVFERAGADTRMLDATRAVTLRGLLKSVLRYTVDIGALILVLSNLGFNTTGLLASVGVASLAIGFGAQNLVRDVITGFFILFEDQFRVGDYIETVDGVSGIVEEMGFRVTKVRDFGGQLHILPNGRIERVTNYSRGPMRVLFTVGIPYEEDIDRAIEIMQRAAEAYAKTDPRIVEGPKVLGVDALGNSVIPIQVWAKTQPMEQWDVARQLRRVIKKALDEAGIETPYPRQVWIPATARPNGSDSLPANATSSPERSEGTGPTRAAESQESDARSAQGARGEGRA